MALLAARLHRAATLSGLSPSVQSSFKPVIARSLPQYTKAPSPTQSRNMAQHVSSYRGNGDNGDDGSTEGELNAWKHRAPYKVHDNDPKFHTRYSGSCHCGKVKYQLSREKPLDAKYCHCHTCQKIHGTVPFIMSSVRAMRRRLSITRSAIEESSMLTEIYRSPLPMVRHLSQGRHQFHPWHT